MKTALEKLKNKYYLIIGDDVTKAQNDVIHNLEARLSKLESAQQPSPHSCGITGHSIRCECTLPADDAAPKVDDSLKLIIDPFFNTLTMRGEVPDDFNLQDALKAAIEILERAQQGKK